MNYHSYKIFQVLKDEIPCFGNFKEKGMYLESNKHFVALDNGLFWKISKQELLRMVITEVL